LLFIQELITICTFILEIGFVLLIGGLSEFDGLVKSPSHFKRWLSKKSDIQGVVFATEARRYMWYVELPAKTCNAGDQVFYDAIRV